MSELESWPGPARREPGIAWPTYALLAPLSEWLQQEARRAHETRGPYRLLDVGCGVKPYYPFFRDYVSEYVGVDVPGNPDADLEGTIESIPVADGSFDVVLCSQVLEHCGDPAQGVRELRRVVAPGGRVLLSTHGVQVYHPAPDDLWRWTHAGLERLFAENGDWRSVTVTPSSGTTACLGMLISTYVDLVAKRARLRHVARALTAAINRAAQAIDARSELLRSTEPGTLHANYHVVADA
jgi:SAM-dependent methyltransferase